MAKGRIEVDEGLCKGCGLCTTVCPKDLLFMAMERLTPRGYHPAELRDPQEGCTGCTICALICPDVAISVYRWIPAAKAGQAVP